MGLISNLLHVGKEMESRRVQPARRGIFLSFQYPMAIPGVKLADFMRHATSNVRNPER